MIHRWKETIELDGTHEIGVCVCGWTSQPRCRFDNGRFAVKKHCERQEVFDKVGRPAPKVKPLGTFYQGVTA